MLKFPKNLSPVSWGKKKNQLTMSDSVLALFWKSLLYIEEDEKPKREKAKIKGLQIQKLKFHRLE